MQGYSGDRRQTERGQRQAFNAVLPGQKKPRAKPASTSTPKQRKKAISVRCTNTFEREGMSNSVHRSGCHQHGPGRVYISIDIAVTGSRARSDQTRCP